MIKIPAALGVPLTTDEHEGIRVSGTRVTLDTLIGYYHQGQTPEDLHEGFPTVPLADLYAVVAYYLANRAEVDIYLQQREAEGERIQQEWEARYPPPTKADLLARLEAQKRDEK
jgi:uncharacterized protein (DUF433 family)